MSRPDPTAQQPIAGPTPDPDDRRLASTRLLTDLVAHPLDGGYQAAHDRRGPDARSQWYDRPLVALGCVLIGFVVVVAYVRTNRGAPAAARVHGHLVARVRAAQRSGDALAAQLDTLQRRLTTMRNEDLPAGGDLARQLRRDQLAAGQLAVDGPGLTVTLAEPTRAAGSSAPARGGTAPIAATNILTDRDVRSVVNELWLDGAEAVAVNGVRLTPTSAVRFAGNAVLVDFAPISPPYRIAGIGSTDLLSTRFAQSAVASRYQTLSGIDHIGFSFTDSDRLHLPAGAAFTPRYARGPTPTRTRAAR